MGRTVKGGLVHLNSSTSLLFWVHIMGDIGSAIIGVFVAGGVIGATAATAAIYGLPWLLALAMPTLRSLVG